MKGCRISQKEQSVYTGIRQLCQLLVLFGWLLYTVSQLTSPTSASFNDVVKVKGTMMADNEFNEVKNLVDDMESTQEEIDEDMQQGVHNDDQFSEGIANNEGEEQDPKASEKNNDSIPGLQGRQEEPETEETFNQSSNLINVEDFELHNEIEETGVDHYTENQEDRSDDESERMGNSEMD